MRQMRRVPYTKEGFEAIKKEFADLKEARKEAVVNLSTARNMGDLSENGLYTAAKARLRSIDGRITYLDLQIKFAEIVESAPKDTVGINSKVTIVTSGKERKIHIVGEKEADPLQGRISNISPLARVLIGRKKGDTVEFEAPAGKIIYKIVELNN